MHLAPISRARRMKPWRPLPFGLARGVPSACRPNVCASPYGFNPTWNIVEHSHCAASGPARANASARWKDGGIVLCRAWRGVPVLHGRQHDLIDRKTILTHLDAHPLGARGGEIDQRAQ